MVSYRQRRRALARAKWERQQARRTATQQRTHRVNIIAGTAVSVVAAGALGWGVYALVQDSNGPSTPTYTDNFPTFKTPTNPGVTITSFSPGAPTTAPQTSAPQTSTPTTPTAPATTESTGK